MLDKKLRAEELIAALRAVGLTGRGGAEFPAWLKWEAVRAIKSKQKFVVCNAEEGEPDVCKDKYILTHYSQTVMEGLALAMEAVGARRGYVYLNAKYFDELGDELEKFLPSGVELFKNHHGYLSGEETAVCQVIEGARAVARHKPPFPSEFGLWGHPTLVSNVETLYWAAKIAAGQKDVGRFYSVSGDVRAAGVWELPDKLSAAEVLERTVGYPDSDFFVQVGGGMSGNILLPEDLNAPLVGCAAIKVYDRAHTDLRELMLSWADFFQRENCDKCVPCREGTYRLVQMLKTNEWDYELLEDLISVLENSSRCALGRAAAVPFRGLMDKQLIDYEKKL